MSLPDTAEKLIRCLQATADRLSGLRNAMSDRRTAWLALRPSQLEQSVDELEHAAADCVNLARERDELMAELAEFLGRSDPRLLRIPTIAARLPRGQANRLRDAAERAAAHAKDLHIEGALGAKLLRFSQESQEGMFRSMVAAPADKARGYDRNARLVSGPISGPVAGAILDGKL